MNAKPQFLSKQDAWEKLKNGALLVDVRRPDEYTTHIEGAINIPHNKIMSHLSELGEDKSREIIVYCAVGGRAEIAKNVLLQAGFTKVFNAGGYDDLIKE